MGCSASKGVPPMRLLDYHGSNFRSNLVQHQLRDVQLDYEVEQSTLGHAAMGCSVRKVVHRKNHKQFAMKTFSLKAKTDSKSEQKKMLDYLRNEIQLLRSLDHPNIVRPIQTYEWAGELHMIMELCGKDLTTRTFNEQEARQIVLQITTAINYCHEKRVCHRDLKLENILFENNDPDCLAIKLIDFGISRTFTSGNPMTERVGTVYIMAPEVILGHYTNKCDMWSLGVITYQLLTGVPPFDGSSDQQTISMSAAVDFNWPSDREISNLAKDFVNHLIVFDPKRRWSAARALHADWLTEPPPLPARVERSQSFKDLMVNTMQNYMSYSPIKKCALMFLAYNTAPEKVKDLKEVFTVLDSKHDGVLTKLEFRQGLRQAGLTVTQIDNIFTAMDFDRSGQVYYLEFVAATIEMLGNMGNDWLASSFEVLDPNHTGYISPESLHYVLGDTFSHQEILDIIAEADLDNNGLIDFDEFCALMNAKSERLPRVINTVLNENEVGMSGDEDVDSATEEKLSLVGVKA